MNKYYEITIFGRGGEGAKTLAQIIGEGGLLEGYHIQAFPEYGPERRGAPVKSYVRLSKEVIRLHEPITTPDCIIVMDGRLIETMPGIKDYNGIYIINSNKDKSYFEKMLKGKKVFVINASKISLAELKLNNPNIVLVGAYLKLIKNINYKFIEEIIKREFEKKGKGALVAPNLNCLKKGYDYFRE